MCIAPRMAHSLKTGKRPLHLLRQMSHDSPLQVKAVRVDILRRLPLDTQPRRLLHAQLRSLPPLAPLLPAHLRDGLARAV